MILVLLAWTSFAIFVVAVAARLARILRLPPHLRWELYPVAHEKGRASYGGSYMEVPEWWTKPRERSRLGELSAMASEILALSGVRRKNRAHWCLAWPFHLGVYLVAAATILLVVSGIAPAAGAVLDGVTAIVAWTGFSLGLLGSLGLLSKRLLDAEYREYTTGLDYANLGFFAATFATAIAAQAAGDPGFARMRAFFAALFGAGAPALPWPQAAEVAALSILVAWVPLTHMSHFFTKWFLYHDIRWGDEPLAPGSRMERRISEALLWKPSWSAPHIAGDGKKTWRDVAEEKGFPEERG